jgi:hypothetical protein
MRVIADQIADDPEQLPKILSTHLPLLLNVYSSCTEVVEDGGHRFGEGLSDKEKKALLAFLATL